MELKTKNEWYMFVARMPKVELHVHLEGSMRLETIIELAHKNRRSLPVYEPSALQKAFRISDFTHFVALYQSIIHVLATEDDYERITYEFCSFCATHNIWYAEVTFTLSTNARLNGLHWKQLVDAIVHGAARGKAAFGVDIYWIFDILRDEPQTVAMVHDALLYGRDKGVVALGLTGDETVPCHPAIIELFDTIHAKGIPATVHAGELGPSKDIWCAINELKAQRIGHGVSAAQDPALLKELVNRNIAVEMCPTSNVCMGSVQSYEKHPLRTLWDAGVCVTINSDDPTIFSTHLTKEYEVLLDHFGFTRHEIEIMAHNAITASFASPDAKSVLKEQLTGYFEQVG